MSHPLAGRTALVTGASRGIGAAVARALAAGGARVALVARSRGTLDALAAALPHAAIVIAADLTSAEAAGAVAREARSAFGADPDIVVHAAGTFPLGPVADVADTELDIAIALNTATPLRLTRALLPGMRARGSGHVVTIGSAADRTVFPGNAIYAATKHAVRAIHEALRQETAGTGIRATLISPAATDTPLWDPHDPDGSPDLPSRAAMLRAEDVAEAVLWAVTRPAHVDVEELRLARS